MSELDEIQKIANEMTENIKLDSAKHVSVKTSDYNPFSEPGFTNTIEPLPISAMTKPLLGANGKPAKSVTLVEDNGFTKVVVHGKKVKSKKVASPAPAESPSTFGSNIGKRRLEL